MRASIALMQFLEVWEDCKLEVYLDEAGRPTIGIGHLILPGEDFSKGLQNDDEACKLLAVDLGDREILLNRMLSGPTLQQHFDALLSLGFNIGMRRLAYSTALKRHNAGFRAEAADAILLWNKATVDGELVESPGLNKRRLAERQIYYHNDYNTAP